MEALVTTFVAAGLAEVGDKSQWMAAALGARYARPGPVLAGAAAAALANGLLAAAGGVLIHDLITLRATSLLLAVALLYAGTAGVLATAPTQRVASSRLPAFLMSFVCLLVAEFGDKTQFLTAALAAQFDSLTLAALGATAGVVALSVPAAVLGQRFAVLVPLTAMRRVIGALFLFIGLVVAVNALRLI